MTPLVLLPGMMCDARLFGPQAVLSARVTLHHPALGKADTIEDMAAGVLADAPPRFALAGLSMGGIVAMEVVRQAPDRVTRLALLDTNHLAEAEAMRARREPQIAAVRAGRLAEVMREEMKPNYLASGGRRMEILDLCMDMALALGPDIFIAQSKALASRPDQTETLRGVKVPTLLLCGVEDRLCPPARHEMMRNLVPGSKLDIIEGAGHLPTLEQPERTNAALSRWLEA